MFQLLGGMKNYRVDITVPSSGKITAVHSAWQQWRDLFGKLVGIRSPSDIINHISINGRKRFIDRVIRAAYSALFHVTESAFDE